MDYINMIAATMAGAALLGLVFLSGYETASRQLAVRYQSQADRRVRGVLDTLNARPASKAAKNRRKLARKAVRK
jgi:hypothetical protein